jgi:hypothetical protein
MAQPGLRASFLVVWGRRDVSDVEPEGLEAGVRRAWLSLGWLRASFLVDWDRCNVMSSRNVLVVCVVFGPPPTFGWRWAGPPCQTSDGLSSAAENWDLPAIFVGTCGPTPGRDGGRKCMAMAPVVKDS